MPCSYDLYDCQYRGHGWASCSVRGTTQWLYSQEFCCHHLCGQYDVSSLSISSFFTFKLLPQGPDCVKSSWEELKYCWEWRWWRREWSVTQRDTRVCHTWLIEIWVVLGIKVADGPSSLQPWRVMKVKVSHLGWWRSSSLSLGDIPLKSLRNFIYLNQRDGWWIVRVSHSFKKRTMHSLHATMFILRCTAYLWCLNTKVKGAHSWFYTWFKDPREG